MDADSRSFDTPEKSTGSPLMKMKQDRDEHSENLEEGNYPPVCGEDDSSFPINNKSDVAKDELDSSHGFKYLPSRDNRATGSKKKLDENRVRRLERYLTSRTGFSRKGLIFVGVVLCLLFIFFIVTVVLAATWPRKTHLELTPVCKSPACLLASADILQKHKANITPCHDFWNFACGNWLTSNPLPATKSKWNVEEQISSVYREKLRELINTLPYPTRSSSVQWKLKHFYESCMSIDGIEADGSGPLLLIINDLGGWNVLREFSVLTYDYRDHLIKLHSKYGVSPFFEVSVVPDPENTEKNIVQVKPSGLGLPDRSYYYRNPENKFAWRRRSEMCVDFTNMTSVQQFMRQLRIPENVLKQIQKVEVTYKRFVKDAAQVLGATSTDAAIFSDEIYHFEKRIAEVTPDTHFNHPLTYIKTSLAEVKLKAPSIPLYDIIAQKYPNAKLDDDLEILTVSEMYLAQISSIISASDRGTLNNYLVWKFASAYLPYLSKRFRDIVNTYISEMTGIQQPMERWETCVETLQRFMGFALATLHESTIDSKIKENNRKIIHEMFEKILESTKSSVQLDSWFTPELKQHIIQKLNVLGLQVGFPGPMLSSTYTEEYYTGLYVQKKNFFKNILFGISFLQQRDQEKLITPLGEYRWLDYMASDHRISYVPVANKIVIPQRILTSPYFHHQFPLSVLYGNFGTHISSAVISSIFPWDIFYGVTGNSVYHNKKLVNETLRIFVNLEKYVASAIMKNGGSEVTANLTALQTVIEISALKISNFALQKALENLAHSHLPAIEEFENDAIFYLTYAQTLCEKSTAEQEEFDILKTSKIKGSLLLKTVLQQVDGFIVAYNCARNMSYNKFPVFKKLV